MQQKKKDHLFNVLLLFRHSNDQEIQNKSKMLQKIYENDIDDHHRDDILHLKSIYDANIQNFLFSPLNY